jgi:hypothetical protein
MSTKDNWDDESSDEEGDLPPKGDTPPGPLFKGEINPLEEYHEAQFVDDNDKVPPEDQTDEECSPEGGAWGDAPQEDSDYDGGAWGDPPDDYDDELDNYDKKLGRYVAFR